MSTEREIFHNRLRILSNLDEFELVEAGAIQRGQWQQTLWDQFRHDPYTFFIVCSDDTCAKLWALIEAKEQRHAPPSPPAA